jgi:hypothetical protein
LHHDVAYFETELSIKLFFANGEASTILPWFLSVWLWYSQTFKKKKKKNLQRAPLWCYWNHSELYNKTAV